MYYRTDLIYLSNDPQPKIKVALANKDAGSNVNYSFVDFKSFLITPEEDPLCQVPSDTDLISSPHSNAFLDLDGDCIPDIFMQKIKKTSVNGTDVFKAYYEIYIQKIMKKESKFCLMHTNNSLTLDIAVSSLIASDIPLIQFVDMDRDGMLDLMFYHKGAVHIHYNQHLIKIFNKYSLNDYGESLCFSQN